MGAHRLQWSCRIKYRTNSHLFCQRKFDQCGAERYPELADDECHYGYDYRHRWQFDADIDLHVPGLRHCE